MTIYAVPAPSIATFYDRHPRYPGGTVCISLLDGNEHGCLGKRPDTENFVIRLEDGSRSVNPHPTLAFKVNEQHPDVRVRQDVSETVVQTVATVIGKNESFFIDYPDRWRRRSGTIIFTASETCITMPLPTRCRDKEERLSFNKSGQRDRDHWSHHRWKAFFIPMIAAGETLSHFQFPFMTQRVVRNDPATGASAFHLSI